jgi:excisionase family DNA binding protein
MSRNGDEPDCLLTIREVAEIQKTCVRTVRRRITAGELPAVRDGRLLRVRARDLRLYQLQRLLG